jgi:D-alanine-D-alanine ligase
MELSEGAALARYARPSRVFVAHNPVATGDDPSTADVLAQVELIEAALAELGVPVVRLAVADWRPWEDLAAAARHPGAMVFNLVEAPPGIPAVHPATAAVIELLGLPFSGSSAAALWLSTDKLATRAVLAAQGLPVAPGGRLDLAAPEILERVAPPWILKPCCEDASLGLDGDAVCATPDAALARGAELDRLFPGQPILVERYLPGRELNVSLLDCPLTALPVAEIAFVDFPAGMPRIVGYEAKWHPDSFAYRHTVRRFPDDAASTPVLAEARRLAVAAWRACGLSGYGRVDLRLDELGAPFILEVNANPCLAVDAGFMAAAQQAGLAPAEVVGRILAAALERHHRQPAVPRGQRLPGAAATAEAPPSRGEAASLLRAVG